MSNVQVMAKAEVLGAPINTVFVKTETPGQKLNVDSQDYEFTSSETTILVHGHPEKPVEKSLVELLTELTFGKVSLKDKTDAKEEEKITSLIKNPNDSTNSTVTEYINGKESSSEYALWIDVDVPEAVMKDFPVKVSQLSFKIWSTDNKQVLEEMEITKAQEMLKEAGVSGNKKLE